MCSTVFCVPPIDSCSLEHTKVHVWYHGTIDLDAIADFDCSIERQEWYVDGGDSEGYHFSRIVGGASERTCGEAK